MRLKNKKILVTAGPTWAPIDAVRVISNISSGRTGVAIADYAAKMGADVTLLLGPKYFGELEELIRRELSRKRFDVIIHAAAVSDYLPVRPVKGKISSVKKRLTITLKPAPKLIKIIRRCAPSAFLVMFKLEAGKTKKELIDIAYESMRRARADLVIANNLTGITKDKHRAYIVDKNKYATKVDTNKELAIKLFRIIEARVDKK